LRHRSRTEIIADILQTLANGASTKTRVMYGAFLSFGEVSDYLSYLVEKDLVSFDDAKMRYGLTSRGAELLDAFEGITNLVAIAPFDRVGASF
jgi:predicted transcriptional regulator